MISRTLLLLVAAAVVAAFVPVSAGAAASPTASAAAAAKKKCKKGYKAKQVRVNGRARTVCRKRKKAPAPSAPAGPAGPSVAEVETIIRELAKAGAPYPMGPESVEVVFDRPTQVMPMVMYNPYEADPLTATGKVETWPVRAWVKEITHRDSTPEDDTKHGGCLGHLNSFWPYDSLYMFFRGQSGEWTFLTSSAEPGDCG